MIRIILFFAKLIQVILIICIIIEIIVFVIGLINDISNPGIKGFGRMGFLYTGVCIGLTSILLILNTLLIRKVLKPKASKYFIKDKKPKKVINFEVF